MDRRNFLSSGAAMAALTHSQPAGAAAAAAKRALMKAGATVQGGGGGRGGNADPEYGFRSLGRWGIKNVVATAQIADGRLYATVDELKRLIDMAGKYGISVDVLNPPFLPSSHIDRERNPAIMLGESPQRDRDIEQIQTMIRNCAAAGPAREAPRAPMNCLRDGMRRMDPVAAKWFTRSFTCRLSLPVGCAGARTGPSRDAL